MKVDYGLDAPLVVRNFAIAGVGLGALAVAAAIAGVPGVPELLGLCAVMLLAAAGAMVRSSRRGKLLERDRMLDELALRGDETVLDVGCGRGLLLLGAARRLPEGRAVGVDVWSTAGQAGNSRHAALANAEAEGVADRVEVLDADMRALPFDDESFDVVVSSIALHALPDRDGRERACREMARVLRPGGRVAVLDARATGDLVMAFEDAGLVDVERSGLRVRMYPPVRLVTARRAVPVEAAEADAYSPSSRAYGRR